MSIYLSPWRHNTNCKGDRKVELVAGVRVQSGESLRGSRTVARRTVPPMRALNGALCRSNEAEVSKQRRMSTHVI